MWDEGTDDFRAYPLPRGALYGLRASRRPIELKLLPLVCACLGGFVAIAMTVVAAGIGEKTVFYCLFVVPAAMTAGLLWGGSRADQLMGTHPG